MTARKLFAAFVALAFLYIASPLVFPIAMGGVLAVLFFPWLEKLEKKKVSTALGSSILTLAITVVLILPTAILTFFVVKAGFLQLESWRNSPTAGAGLVDSFLGITRVQNFMLWVTRRIPVNMTELAGTLQEVGRVVGARLAEFLGGVLGHVPGMLIGLPVIVVSTYFFLVDGRRLVLYCRSNSIFSVHQTDQIIDTIESICRSVILASVVSGGMQALIEVLACVFTGTPNVALIGLLVFVGSFIPVIGAAPVTFTVGLIQILAGREYAGVILLIVAVIIIAVDNTVRPLFLRGSANLHPLVAFVAAFGGLQTLGFLGVFLGPIIAALFLVTLKILIYADDEQL